MSWKRLWISCLAGPVAVVLAWVVIGASWYMNREWFVFVRDAYSDFGGPESCCPGLYNYGLMLVGALVVVFGACTYLCAPGRLGAAGGAYFALAGVFLALIGVFPSGTRPHTFVSTWFFVQADMGLVLLLASMRRGGGLTRLALLASILAFPVAGIVEVAVGWPSAAVVETYGIIIIDIGAIAAFLWCRRHLHTRV